MKYIVSITLILLLFSCKQQHENNLNVTTGSALGTTYAVQFIHEDKLDYTKAFDSLFAVINESMSTYQKDSDISKINNNIGNTIDDHFKTVFEASKIIYNKTNGAFDPTIGVMVNAWDFGPEGKIASLDSLKIESLMTHVGFNKVTRDNLRIVKEDQDTFIDFNAIAKGYMVDVIAEFLEQKEVANYLVEIGGEIRAKGTNLYKKQPWKIGIEDPNFDGTQSVHQVINLKDKSMATSGTYRKFKIDENGNRYSHIINTKTGYPSKTNILSVSVIADNCMLADAYATAFKAMGIEETKDFLKNEQQLAVYFIFEDEGKKLQTLALNGFPVTSEN